MRALLRRGGFFLIVCASLTAASPGRAHAGPTADSLRKAVAVLYFVNHTGEARYDPFGKGLASMMITDLASLSYLQLIEREHLESLVKELELQQSTFFDEEVALQIGHFVGAEYVVTGSIMAVKPALRIDARVIRVETSEVVKAAEVSGKEDRLFQLQGLLADQLIDGLDVALSPEARAALRAAQEANRINDVETALAFSEALYLYDQGDYVSALERMNYVRTHAPASQLVALTVETIREDLAQRGKQELKGKINNLLRKWKD